MRTRALLTLLAATLLCGCASGQIRDDDQVELTRFVCGALGGVGFRPLSTGTAELTVDGNRSIIEQQRSASGARYTGDGIEFWTKGIEAMLTRGDDSFQCVIAGGD